MEKEQKEMTAEEKAAAYDKMVSEGKTKAPAEAPANTDTVVFWTLPRSAKNKVELRRSVYKEKEILGLQQFYKEDSTDTEWKYGKAVTFGFEDIDDLIDGLQKMKDWCVENS
jgi:hypothetical protein